MHTLSQKRCSDSLVVTEIQINIVLYHFSEKAMAPHSSTEEPGRLQSMGLLESDTTEWLHFHFSLWCIGEGNGNPLQCSCLENPRDGGAWWAAVYGVTQSRTWLKQFSSSSSSITFTYKSGNIKMNYITWYGLRCEEISYIAERNTKCCRLIWRQYEHSLKS